jgi:SAM-dependent methyltransferase
MSNETFWDTRYAGSAQVWSGRPNVVLQREVAGLTPGRALDLGCGEGADAVWLAGLGWHVTAVDVSGVALRRGAAQAEAAGVAGRIDWQRHDLAESFPDGTYDLVSAQFLYSWSGLPRTQVLRRAADAVAPGGILLVESHLDHGPFPAEHDGHEVHFDTPEELIRDLGLDAADRWEVLLADAHERSQTGPDGRPAVRTDSTLKARRVP